MMGCNIVGHLGYHTLRSAQLALEGVDTDEIDLTGTPPPQAQSRAGNTRPLAGRQRTEINLIAAAGGGAAVTAAGSLADSLGPED